MNFTDRPPGDPSPLFELYRSNYASELLVASSAHFDLFVRVEKEVPTPDELWTSLGLNLRAGTVLITALRALGLLVLNSEGRLALSEMARDYLLPSGPFYIGTYFSLASDSPGVLRLVEQLRSARPAGETSHGSGAAFIFREDLESAMEVEGSARSLTLVLAGRARNVAPHLAPLLRLAPGETLLDVGAGSGLFTVTALQWYPELRAIALERPEVLKVVEEFARKGGVETRLTLVPGGMFRTPLPQVDAILLSNVLHDWSIGDCRALVQRCAAALRPGGRLYVHDAFLNDDLGGPLPVALYSVALFGLTEGRAYSGSEVAGWLMEAGLTVGPIEPTLIHCGMMTGLRSGNGISVGEKPG